MANDPKSKLIKSATSVFATQGYTSAKIVDIVKGANANIAAVNYHFGSKENLFIEALRNAFNIANVKYPTSGNLPKSAPPLERVAAFANSILRRSFDHGPAGDFNRIMRQTAHSPDSPIDRIMTEVRSLEMHAIENALADLLPNQPETVINHAKMNLISLATVFSKYPFIAKYVLPENITALQIDHFIEIQTNVILNSLEPLIQASK